MSEERMIVEIDLRIQGNDPIPRNYQRIDLSKGAIIFHKDLVQYCDDLHNLYCQGLVVGKPIRHGTGLVRRKTSHRVHTDGEELLRGLACNSLYLHPTGKA